MDNYAKLGELLKTFGSKSVRENIPVLFQAKVMGVEGDCCRVDASGVELTDIRLKATINGKTEGVLLLIPEVGSVVLVGSLTGDFRDLAVLSADRFSEIRLGGSTFGGLVKVTELVKKLNLLEKDINNLKTVVSGWTPVAQDGGAALKMALSSWTGSSLAETQQAELENSKIKQG